MASATELSGADLEPFREALLPVGGLGGSMATFFGEVVAAPSRAGVDDEDEEAAAAAEREETPEDREIRRGLEKKR